MRCILFGSAAGLLLLLFTAAAAAQSITVTVVDQNGSPIAGARITIAGGQPLAADSEGRATFAVSESNDRVTISALGFAPVERRVRDLQNSAVITLLPSTLREDVLINITRAETRLGETPASVVVLDRAAISTSAAQTVDDALRQVAGFTLFRRGSSKTSNPTTHGANLRGIGGSGAARTSVAYDGVSLNDAFGGWTWWTRVPRIAIEQIEVLRGGASWLYGRSALSGAINLEPDPRRSKALRFEASGGTQGTYDGSFYAAYPVGNWSFELAGERSGTQGYFPIPVSNRGSADTRSNSRHGSGIITIERKFGERSRAFLRGVLFSEDRDNGTRLTTNGTYFRQAIAGADHLSERFGNFRIRASIDSQIYDQTFAAVSSDRNSENLTRIQRVPSKSYTANITWDRSASEHTFAAAFDVRGVRGFSNETAIGNGRATAFVSSGGQEFGLGASVHDMWRVTDRFVVSFGARYDHWREYDASSVSRSLTSGAITAVRFPERSERKFSPRIAALFQVTRNVSAFASFNTSFRAPSLNELYRGFRVGSVITLANEDLRAERARTFEGGVAFVGFSRRFSLRSNLFWTTVVDPVVSVTITASPTLITRMRQNVGETRTRGVEIDAEYAPGTRLRFSAAYLFSDSTVSASPANSALIGKRVPQTARSQFTFQGTYRPFTPITLSVQGRASGEQFDDDLNLLRLGPYFTLDAFTSYKFPKMLEIFAAAENVLNSRYDIGLTPNPTIAAPRSVRIGLRFDLMRRSR